MATRAPDRGRIVEWCRKGYAPWRSARKRAVQYHRNGYPTEWITRALGVSRQWVHRWVARFREGGKHWSALESRSTRPRRVHARRHAHAVRVLELKRCYPHMGALKLKVVGGLPLSHQTVHRVLQEHRLVNLHPRKHHVWRRFQRPLPNYLWQLDYTYVKLASGDWSFIATLLDDCTRFVVASRVYARDPTAGDVIALVEAAVRQWGRPRQILTDRGTQFSAMRGQDSPSLFTQRLMAWGIQHIRARPRHPQTCGKLERWHRSLKEEWLGRRWRAGTVQDLHHLLMGWVTHYNTVRPHASLGYRVPVEAYMGALILEEEFGRVVNKVP